MGRQTYEREVHLFDHNVHAHLRYNELQRDERLWNSVGQYKLAHECSILAQRLLNGDESQITVIIKTEGNYINTKKN